MNIDTFIKDFIIEYTSHPDCYDDIVDLLDVTIEDIVINNTIDENKKIIITYICDIYIAIQLYKTHLDDINTIYQSISLFYERLAFVSLFATIYPKILNSMKTFTSDSYLDETQFIQDFINEYSNYRDSYCDIIDLLDVTLDDYVSNNSLFLNKQIILDNCGNIENAINLYIKNLGNITYTTLEHLYSQLVFAVLFIKLYPEIIKLL